MFRYNETFILGRVLQKITANGLGLAAVAKFKAVSA